MAPCGSLQWFPSEQECLRHQVEGGDVHLEAFQEAATGMCSLYERFSVSHRKGYLRVLETVERSELGLSLRMEVIRFTVLVVPIVLEARG